MTSTTLLYIAATLALSPLAHARGRTGSGRGRGGGSSGSSDSCIGCVTIGSWQVDKKWVIIAGAVIGVIVLCIVAAVLIWCGFFRCLTRRFNKRKPAAQRKADYAYLQQEAQRMQTTKAGVLPTGEWGPTWRPGPRQHYVQIQPAHSHTPSTWSNSSQQKLPYAQGGLGYATEPSVYHPPTPQAPYSIPYNPPHQ